MGNLECSCSGAVRTCSYFVKACLVGIYLFQHGHTILGILTAVCLAITSILFLATIDTDVGIQLIQAVLGGFIPALVFGITDEGQSLSEVESMVEWDEIQPYGILITVAVCIGCEFCGRLTETTTVFPMVLAVVAGIIRVAEQYITMGKGGNPLGIIISFLTTIAVHRRDERWCTCSTRHKRCGVRSLCVSLGTFVVTYAVIHCIKYLQYGGNMAGCIVCCIGVLCVIGLVAIFEKGFDISDERSSLLSVKVHALLITVMAVYVLFGYKTHGIMDNIFGFVFAYSLA